MPWSPTPIFDAILDPPGWSPTAPNESAVSIPGWWVGLDLDIGLSVNYVTDLQFRALKKLGLVVSVGVT